MARFAAFCALSPGIRQVWAAAVALALGLSLAMAGPAAADDDVAQARDVIERQLEAFSRDAWAEAFAFAGPGVRNQFQTPERFAEMVRRGYPMVWRPDSVRFLDAETRGAYQVQRLRVTDADGDAYLLRYYLQQIDGVWRIEGVDFDKEPSGVA